MLTVLEMAVQAQVEKMVCFVENGIFSISNRTEHVLSPPFYHTMEDCSSVELKYKMSMKGRTAKGTMLSTLELYHPQCMGTYYNQRVVTVFF